MGWRKCVPVLLCALILANPKCGGHVWNEEDEARALHEGRGRFFSASPTPVFGGVPVAQSGGRTQNDIPALNEGRRPSSQLERHTEGGFAFGGRTEAKETRFEGRTQDNANRFQYPTKDRFQDTVNRFEGRTQGGSSDRYSRIWTKEDEIRAINAGQGRLRYVTPDFGAGVLQFDSPRQNHISVDESLAPSQGRSVFSQFQGHIKGGSSHFGERTQDSDAQFDDYSQSWTKEDELRAIKAGRGKVRYATSDFGIQGAQFGGRTLEDSQDSLQGRDSFSQSQTYPQDNAAQFEDLLQGGNAVFLGRTQDGPTKFEEYPSIVSTFPASREYPPKADQDAKLEYLKYREAQLQYEDANGPVRFQGHSQDGPANFEVRTQDVSAKPDGRTQDGPAKFEYDYVKFEGRSRDGAAKFESRTQDVSAKPDGRTQDGPAKFEYDYFKFQGLSPNGAAKFKDLSEDGPVKFEGRSRDGSAKFEGRTQDGPVKLEGRSRDGSAKFEGRTQDRLAKFEYDYVKFEGLSQDGSAKPEGRTQDSTAKLEGRTQGKESRSQIWTKEDESLAISEGRGKVRYATPEFGVHTSQPQVDDRVQAENRAPDHTTQKQVSKLTGEIEEAEIIEEAEPIEEAVPICLTCRFFEEAKKPVEIIKLKKPEPEKSCLSCHIFDEPASDEAEAEARQPGPAESEGGVLRGTLNLIAGLFQGKEPVSTEKETQQNPAPINPKFRAQDGNVDLEYPPKGDQAKIEYLRYRKGQQQYEEAKQDYVSSPSAGFAARAQDDIKANPGSRSQSGEGFSGHPQDKDGGSFEASDSEYSQERPALPDSTQQDTAARYGSQTQPILIPLRQNPLNQHASADARIISEVQDSSASSESRSDQTQDPLASANGRFGGKIKIPSFASVNAGFGGKIIKKPSFASVNAGFGGNIIIKKPSFASVNAGFGGKIIKKPSFASVNAGFGGQIRHPSVGFGYRSRNEAAETRFRDREQDQSATNTRVGGQIEGQSEAADNRFGAQINDQPSSGFAPEYAAAGRGPQTQDIHIEDEYRQSLLDTNAQDSPSAALPNVQIVQLRPTPTQQQQKSCTTCHLVQDAAPSEGSTGQVKVVKLVDVEESVEPQHNRSPALVETIKLSKGGVDTIKLSKTGVETIKVSKLMDRKEESVKEEPKRRLSASSVRSKKKTRGCRSCFLFDD